MEAAAARYALFPTALRELLYARIISDPNSPFTDQREDSEAGRFFDLAIGNYIAPEAQLPLNEIIMRLPIENHQKEELANRFIVHMNALQPQVGGPQVGGRKRRRGRSRRRSSRRRSSRKN